MISILTYLLIALMALGLYDGTFISLLLWTVVSVIVVYGLRFLIVVLCAGLFLRWCRK